MLTDVGPVEAKVPRDVAGTFEPAIVKKRQRRLTGVEEMVLSLSAKGLTHGEISAHLAEVYGASVSRATISTITDKVMDGMACAGFGLQTLGGGQPCVVSAVVVAGGDLGGGCDDFTDVRATVEGRAEITQGLEPELLIVPEHQLLHCISLSRTARKVCGGRPVRRWTVSVMRSSAPSAMARSMPASIAANSAGTCVVRRSRICS